MGTMHKVQQGEYLSRISKKYGFTKPWRCVWRPRETNRLVRGSNVFPT